MSSDPEATEMSRIAAAERIALAAAALAQAAIANGLTRLVASIETVILEAWREASEPDTARDEPGDRRR